MLPDVAQAEGLNATFYCQLPKNGSIEWKINGTSFRDINTSKIVKQGRGEETEVVIIHALPQLNKTGLVCELYTINENGTVMFIESTRVLHLLYKVTGHIFQKSLSL